MMSFRQGQAAHATFEAEAFSSQVAAAEDDYANGGDKEEDADDLEGEVKTAEEGHADFVSIGVSGAGQRGEVIGGGGEGFDHVRDEDDETVRRPGRQY
jgi:hypothetical protein